MHNTLKNHLYLLAVFLIIMLSATLAYYRHADTTPAKVVGSAQTGTQGFTEAVDTEVGIYEFMKEYCPYTSGSTYRQCLFDFSEQAYKELEVNYSNLVKDVKGVMEDDLRKNGDNNDNSPRRDFLKKLETYHKNWRLYIESYCELDASIFWGGTGQGEAITLCKIDETKEYISRLEDFREDWVKSIN